MNINQIAEKLHIHQSTCTVNVQALEDAKLIHTSTVASNTKGSQKLCSTNFSEIVIPLHDFTRTVSDNIISTQMPIGLYTSYECHPPCGIVSEKEIIGMFDICDSFSYPQRSNAQLIWISGGYLEYKFPKRFPSDTKIKSISFQAEICSEYPGSNPNWPSDITIWINGKEIGTWCSPGDMGGSSRGKLTPSWWMTQDTQYGFLKRWLVNHTGSYIDGQLCSSITVEDLSINSYSSFTVRIGVKENATCYGGLNLFGSKFGNYSSDLIFSIEKE